MSGFLANALTRSLARIFRDGASVTSVASLRKEGYRNVSVLRLSHLEELVGAAIEKVITEVTSDPEAGRRMARDAQVELLRMLGERDAIARATEDLRREQRSLERNVGQLHSALDDARGQLQNQLAARGEEALGELHRKLDDKLDEVFHPVLEDHVEEPVVGRALQELRGPLEDAMLALLGTALAERPVEPEAEAAQVELLERRIRKLNASLDEANGMMARLRDERDGEEAGVSSIYNEVQGLRGHEERYEERRKLMQEIFRLNLDLKKEISDG